MNSWDLEYLPGRGHDEELAAGLAPVVRVDAVVGLLFAHGLERLVLALTHCLRFGFRGLYAFGIGRAARSSL